MFYLIKSKKLSQTIFLLASLIQTYIFSNWLLSNDQNEFKYKIDNFKFEVESIKSQVFLLNEILKSVLESNQKTEDLISITEIYTMDRVGFENSLIPNVNNKFHEIFSREHDWFELTDLLYLKFPKTQTILSDRSIPQLEDSKAALSRLFSKQYCEDKLICTWLLSSENLSDGFVFSLPHIDVDTKKTTITVTSPVYINGNVVAETHVDVQLDAWSALNGKQIISSRNGERITLTITNAIGLAKLFRWETRFSLDNFTDVIYERTYLPIIGYSALFLLIVLGINSLFYLYLEQYKKHARVVQESRTDSMTGCYNRRVYEMQKFRDDLMLHATNTVIVFDGNNIKTINDQYGHDTGDAAIKTIAKILMTSFRKTDYIIRIGGDEFIVIAPGTTPEKIHSNIDDINLKLAQSPLPHDIIVSVSSGYSAFRSHRDLESAIRHADSALYRAKKSNT